MTIAVTVTLPDAGDVTTLEEDFNRAVQRARSCLAMGADLLTLRVAIDGVDDPAIAAALRSTAYRG